MRIFALVIFIIHCGFELLFGLSAYVSGASSSQSAIEVAAQSVQLTIAFRFMGAALIALGVLGLVVIFGPGVSSRAARVIAMGFAVFHGLGALGSIFTAAPTFEVYQNPLSLGALVVHSILALGFVVIILRPINPNGLNT
ncbi:hypothetical protein [Loktanella sp. S4079]|uniref:hypothetical protein n=1 Tax=Loktanella sp. S4079 TaxID=579483 RepID=UPI0005FA06A5|nr:hypothetical protein [Loktanella sp. S4079]KJZ18728.1 hypothetical protein TW80_13195 [Loktanella sp. S4079]